MQHSTSSSSSRKRSSSESDSSSPSSSANEKKGSTTTTTTTSTDNTTVTEQLPPPSSNIPYLLQTLKSQIQHLNTLADKVGTKADSIKVRRQINLFTDLSLQLLRQVHVQSSSSNAFQYHTQYNSILSQFEVCSQNVKEKLSQFPEKKLDRKKKDNLHEYDDLLDSMREEEQDELVQLLDSFHETEDSNINIKKWSTWGLLLGGSLLGMAIGGPVGGYAFYAGAGSLSACLGLGMSSGAIAGASGSWGLKKLKSWAKKRKERLAEQRNKKND